MTSERRQELQALCEKATPGPWGWELNISCKSITLESREWCVMAFGRWGMGGAAPLFLDGSLKRVEMFGEIEPGREHHAHWHRKVVHPDADFIAASRQALPELLTENAHLRKALEQLKELSRAKIVGKRAFKGFDTVETERWSTPTDNVPELAEFLGEGL